MLHVVLSGIFRLSGHTPHNRKSDKYVAIIFLGLFLIASVQSVIFWDSTARDNLHVYIVKTSVYGFLIGSAYAHISANLSEIKYVSLTSQVSRSATSKSGPFSSFIPALLLVYFYHVVIRMFLAMHAGLGFIKSVGRALTFHMYTVPCLKFLLIVDQLEKRFLLINKDLRATAVDPQCNVSSIFREHLDLCKLVANINSYFSSFHLIVGTSRVLFLTSQMYALLVSISDEKKSLDVAEITSVLCHILFIVAPSYIGHHCAWQANETVRIAHRLIRSGVPEELIDEVVAFSLAAFNNPVRFSVAGVFYLDNSYMTQVAGFCVTYLIVAIQLKNM